MRIAILAPEMFPVPPQRGESVEVCVWAIARRLAKRHQVTVISRAYPGYPKTTEKDGLTIVRLPSGTAKRYLRHVLSYLQGKSFDWIQIDNRPRYVGPVKRLLPGTPVSLFLHSLNFVTPPNLSVTEASACLAKADVIVANSGSLRRELRMRYPKVAGRLRSVWLGVETSRFRPANSGERGAAQRKYGLDGDRFTVLFAGRLIARKGVPVLIRAVRQAQQVSGKKMQLVVAGKAQRQGYPAQLRKLAAQQGVRIRFLGAVPHERMHLVYRAADCFVCPSQQHEAFGLVNVEAMASGVPVIASAMGGIKEIVKHGQTGLLVRSYRQPGRFAQAIAQLARSPERCRRLADAGRSSVLRRFSWEHTAGKLEALYRRKR